MEKKKRIHKIVLRVLEYNPDTRSDDFKLIMKVYKDIYPEVELENIFKNHIEFDVPSCETITRARRKIQNTHTHLRDAKTTELRIEEEKVFRAYARSQL